MEVLKVAVVDADKQNCRELCALLEQANIPVAPLYSLEDLPEHLKREPVAGVDHRPGYLACRQ